VIDWTQRTLRSLLFAPGNHARRLERVADFGADSIVLDLEDAVADSEKTLARTMVREALPTYPEQLIVFVRVNGTTTGRTQDDIDAIVCADLDAIVVPKIEDPAELHACDGWIAAAEGAAGLPVGSIRMIGLVETAKGLIRVEEICAQAPERLITIGFGAGDFTVDLGIDLTNNGREILYARSKIVIAARAAGLRAPIDGPFLHLQDIDALIVDTQLSRQLGFEGRVVVYPPQVEHVHRAYSDLTPAEVDMETKVVEQFEEALRGGLASIQVEGRFVDYPIYYRAQKKLRLYNALRESA